MLSTDEGSEKESQKVGIEMEDELEEDNDGSLSKIPVAPRGLVPCFFSSPSRPCFGRFDDGVVPTLKQTQNTKPNQPNFAREFKIDLKSF